jgi:acyl carrier protein
MVEKPQLPGEQPPLAEDLKPRIKQLLIDMLFLQNIEPAAIGDEDNLQETLGVDSVALFQVVAGLEEAFGIRIEDKDFDAEKFSTVAGIETVVKEKLAGNA